jgi:GT2 family glycosyltransferase
MSYSKDSLPPRQGQPTILTDISIVIPTLGRPILRSCLASIAAGDSWPDRVVVVDQSSSDAVAGYLAELEEQGIGTLYLASSQRGRSAGVNRGLERLETRFVAVTDDDCFVNSDWLRRMRQRLSENPEAIVSGRVEAAGDETAVAVVTDRKPAVYRRPRLKFDAMSGGNMGTSREVLDRVGYFDEDPRLRLAEDCDWSYRGLRAGVPILYAPEVCLQHYGWRDSEQRSDQYRAYARSHGGFYGKYLRRGDWFIALRAALHFGRAFRRWLRGVLTRDRERIANGRAYLTGLPLGIIAGLRRKSRD